MIHRSRLTLAIWAMVAVACLSVLGSWRRASLRAPSSGPSTLVPNGSALQLESEPIVMTFVVITETTAHESAVAIKSALMYTSRPLHFHIVCTEDAIPILESKFALVQRPSYPIEVTYYNITGDYIKERCERAGIGSNYNFLVKVLLQEVLDRDVEKAIFMDTDMIFTVDPLLLWNEFAQMTSHQLIAFPTTDPEGHPGTICSCIMLLRLAQMRDPTALLLPSTLLPATQQTSIGAQVFAVAKDGEIPLFDGNTQTFNPMDSAFGDQGIFHALWWYRRDLFMHLSLRWDITNCRGRYGLSLGRFGEEDGPDVTEDEHVGAQGSTDQSPEADMLIVPGILHLR